MTIGVKGNALVIRVRGCCTEVWGSCITAPAYAYLKTIACVTGNKEAGIEQLIADHELVRVRAVCSHTVPQSICISSIPIIICGRNGLVDTSLEVRLLSSLVIYEDYFCELNKRRDKKLFVDGPDRFGLIIVKLFPFKGASFTTFLCKLNS